MSFNDWFKPRWKHGDPDVRLAAVEKISKQSILEGLALSDIDERVKIAAISKLENQGLLYEIVRNVFNSGSSKLAALSNIIDKNILNDIAINALLDERLRMAAMDKIYDIAAWEIVARNENEDNSIRKHALMRLKGHVSPTVITEIKKLMIDKETRKQQDLYITARDSNKAMYNRIDAVSKLKDKHILEELASDKQIIAAVRVKAINRVANIELFKKLASDPDEDLWVRQRALWRLEDGNLKSKILNSERRLISINRYIELCKLRDFLIKHDNKLAFMLTDEEMIKNPTLLPMIEIAIKEITGLDLNVFIRRL